MSKFFWIICLLSFASCSRSTLNFTASSIDKNEAPARFVFEVDENDYDAYEWNLGDGSAIKNDTIISHRYYLSGNYEIILKGQKGKKTHTIKKDLLVNAPEKCLIRIETPYGEMIAELFDDTPKHRDNFTKLAEEGFYNDLLFHRVINGFMIQGGDPNSKNADSATPLGSGGPGYQVDAEFSEKRAHVKGALAAARLPDNANPSKKSSGSQFYIVHGRKVENATINQFEARLDLTYPTEIREQYLATGGVPFLDQEYTVFGQVIEGLEVIDQIASVRTGSMDRPLENVSMKISLIK